MQVMKPMPGLDDAARAGRRQGRVRHQDALGHQAGRRGRRRARSSTSSSRSAARSSPPGWCRSSSPRSTSTARRRPRPRRCSRRPSSSSSSSSPATSTVMLKLTLPEEDGFYAELVAHPNVLRVVALSGGYSREEANARLARNHGRDRQLLPGAHRGPLAPQQSDEEFDAALDAIDQEHLRGVDHLSADRGGSGRHVGSRPSQRRGGRSAGDVGPTCQTPSSERSASARRRSGSTGSSSASPATPATACSSPATASPAPARCSATTWRRCPTSRPRSGPRPARWPASRAFQVHISDHDITTPGDAPERARGHEPGGAAQPSCARLEPGGTVIVNDRHLRRAQPHQGRLRRQPAHRRHASRATRSTRCR